MDIRNSLDGLKGLLGVGQAAAPAAQPKPASGPSPSALTSDKATLSSAGSQVSLTAADSDVRPEKVASIQAALASGSYSVAPGAVAAKMVDAMISAKP